MIQHLQKVYYSPVIAGVLHVFVTKTDNFIWLVSLQINLTGIDFVRKAVISHWDYLQDREFQVWKRMHIQLI